MATGHAEITGGLLSEKDLKANGWLVDDGAVTNSSFYITEVGNDDVQLVDGVVTVVEGDRKQIVELDGSAYDFDIDEVGDEAQEIVDLVKANGGQIDGIIIVNGDHENQRDPCRFRFFGTQVEQEYPSLKWDDGTDASEYFE